MIIIQLDNHGKWITEWPLTDDELLTAVRKYLTHEATLDPAQQIGGITLPIL